MRSTRNTQRAKTSPRQKAGAKAKGSGRAEPKRATRGVAAAAAKPRRATPGSLSKVKGSAPAKAPADKVVARALARARRDLAPLKATLIAAGVPADQAKAQINASLQKTFGNAAWLKANGLYSHAKPREKNDWYQEERWVTELLLGVERLYGICWDPFAGAGNIPAVVRAAGFPCRATDLVDRGCPDFELCDFLHKWQPFELGRVDIIVSNPPFKRATIREIILRCLDLARHKVALFLPLTFQASETRTYVDDLPLARVYPFGSRPSVPPGHYEGPREGGKGDFAWYVFEHGWQGRPIVMRRLILEGGKPA